MWRRFNFFEKRALQPSRELARLNVTASCAGPGPYGQQLCFLAADAGAHAAGVAARCAARGGGGCFGTCILRLLPESALLACLAPHACARRDHRRPAAPPPPRAPLLAGLIYVSDVQLKFLAVFRAHEQRCGALLHVSVKARAAHTCAPSASPPAPASVRAPSRPFTPLTPFTPFTPFVGTAIG